MHIVVTYDVVDDRRRTRFFKRLKALLLPVQKSVFEGRLPESRRERLVKLIHRELDLNEDSVRCYVLCRTCRDLVVTYGVGPSVPDPEEPIVV